tara:strand:- start:12 stop:236 length:225 start_codon:yes stop_codon:yes gene_type:complete
MKYFNLLLILTLWSCSFEKKSSYWNEYQKKQSINDKKLISTLKNITDFETMTFEEFSLFVEDYANKTEYPNMDN